MDPLEIFPEEVCESIFTYFNKKDIMNASLVSKHWYRLTGRSKECMKKIMLFTYDFRTMLDIKYILASERQYQHLHFCHEHSNIKQNTKLMRSLRSLVNKFARSLITLKSNVDILRTSELPKLKELTICCNYFYPHHNCIYRLGLTTKANGLKKLSIKCTDLRKSSVKALQLNISNLQKLKVLKIRDPFLLDGLGSTNYKLEEFYLIHRRFDWIPSYFEFFLTQQSHLKFIDSHMSFEQLALIMKHFPRLETIFLRNSVSDEDEMERLMNLETLKYPFNESIKTFGYDGFVFNGETDNIVAILPKLLNLRSLHLNIIDLKTTDAILELPSLVKVEYRHIDDMFVGSVQIKQQNIKLAKSKLAKLAVERKVLVIPA